MAKLCLGTAQLGMQYGINNKVGKLDKSTVFEILDSAVDNGIEMIDTASIYGDAEVLLGEYFATHVKSTQSIKVISKQCHSVAGLSANEIEKCMQNELRQSLMRLGRKYLNGYLLHSYRESDNMDTLRVLQRLKEKGLVEKIGVSVYEVDEAEHAIENGNIDYLQMPYSIFDQRGITEGVFQKARDRGITIFTRSAFLQGLLTMSEEEIPAYLKGIIPYVKRLEGILLEYQVERKQAVLQFVFFEDLIDYMVFGIETKGQLLEIIENVNSREISEELVSDLRREFKHMNTELILPINWGKDKC